MSVVCLSGKAYTPEICLRDVLEDVKDLEHVVVVAHYKDGTTQTISSHMSLQQLCYMERVLSRRMFNVLEATSE